MELNDAVGKMRARRIYANLLNYLVGRGIEFKADETEMKVDFGFIGEDIPMPMVCIVNENLQTLRIISPLPFNVPQDKYIDICMATTFANSHLTVGAFQFDMDQGVIVYSNCDFFFENEIGAETIDMLIDIACAQVDHYNDRFLAIAAGKLSAEDFITEG